MKIHFFRAHQKPLHKGLTIKPLRLKREREKSFAVTFVIVQHNAALKLSKQLIPSRHNGM
jgi:hypothetical protein